MGFRKELSEIFLCEKSGTVVFPEFFNFVLQTPLIFFEEAI